MTTVKMRLPRTGKVNQSVWPTWLRRPHHRPPAGMGRGWDSEPMASLKPATGESADGYGERLRAAGGQVGERDGVERAGGRDLALRVRADGVFEDVERIDGLKGDLVVGGGDAGRKRNAAQVEGALQGGIVRAPHRERVAAGVGRSR